MNAARPVLAGTIVAVLVAGIAVAVIRPGDLGDERGSEAAGPTTTTAPAAGESLEPAAPEEPGTTAPSAPGDGAEGTTTTAPAPTPTTVPAPPFPGGTGGRSPGDGAGDTAGDRPAHLAHTGGSGDLAPLAAALLLAGVAGGRMAGRRDAEPAP